MIPPELFFERTRCSPAELVHTKVEWNLFLHVVIHCKKPPDQVSHIFDFRHIMSKEAQIRAAINQKLIEMGERER